MAGGGRVFGGDGSGSTLASLLHSQSVLPPTSSDGFFLSGSSPSLCSRAIVSFEDVPGGSGLGGSFFRLIEHDENGDDDIDDYFHQPEKKRRLTLDQVQFLEKSFEVENKLEPERKVQLAKDLGLQPRQVAIWFQNRRARWKTKQLEKDYEVLQSNYNNLKADFDNLIKERDQLKAEVLDLTDKLLLKAEEENSKPSSRASERPPGQVVCLVSDQVSEVPVPVCKHDDISSIKSDIVDSDSPNYTDGALLELGDSSYVFEPDQSDLSQDEEDVPSNSFLPLHMSSPKVENSDHYPGPLANSCSFGFNPEDHAFWSWSY